jgi:hypothetical protein
MSIDSISASTTFYKGQRAPCVPQCYILSQVGVRFSFVTVPNEAPFHRCHQDSGTRSMLSLSHLPNTLLSAIKVLRGGPVLCQWTPLPLIMERGNWSLISSPQDCYQLGRVSPQCLLYDFTSRRGMVSWLS